MLIQNKKKIFEYILCLLSGALFVCLASEWVNPFFKEAYGYDSSWFTLMGRAILEGKVPYRAYFDLKGPCLFFYEALGQLIKRGECSYDQTVRYRCEIRGL